jgi:hypothetical protein
MRPGVNCELMMGLSAVYHKKKKLFGDYFFAAMVIDSLLLFLHSSSFPPPLQPNVPGPRFFPKIILASMGFLCLLLLFENLTAGR